MQEYLNYKVSTVIDNWFKHDYDNLDYDAGAPREAIADTAYCAWCNSRKSVSLMTYTYDTSNRKVAKCKACASKITKGVKK